MDSDSMLAEDDRKIRRRGRFLQNLLSSPEPVCLPIRVNIQFAWEDAGGVFMVFRVFIPATFVAGDVVGSFMVRELPTKLEDFIERFMDRVDGASCWKKLRPLLHVSDGRYGVVHQRRIHPFHAARRNDLINDFARLLDDLVAPTMPREPSCEPRCDDIAKRRRLMAQVAQPDVGGDLSVTTTWTADLESAFRRGEMETLRMRGALESARAEASDAERRRETSEAAKAEAEAARAKAEAARAKAEAAKAEAEAARVKAEASRAKAEASRAKAEASRALVLAQFEMLKTASESEVRRLREALETTGSRARVSERNVAMREGLVMRRETEMLGREQGLVEREASVWERERELGDMPVEQREAAKPVPDDDPGIWKVERVVANHDARRAWVRLAESGIRNAGRGVFACVNLSKGQLITRVNGQLMSRDQASGFSTHEVVCPRRTGKAYVVRMADEDREAAPEALTAGLGMFVNSADFVETKKKVGGNVKYTFVCPKQGKRVTGRDLGDTPAFYIEATRDIKAGEELLVATYGAEYWRKLYSGMGPLPGPSRSKA